MHYRYEDAAAYYRKAIEANPRLWSAHSALGIDLMRLGKEDEPMKELELSYNNGYRDAATVNSLRLLDSYKNFTPFATTSTILKLNKTEAGLLQPYMQSELHAIIATYDKKYRMKLPGAGAGGGVSGPRRLRCAHDGHAGFRRTGRDLRRSRGHGQSFGTQARRFQLGRDAVARDEPRLHTYCHQSSRAAVVH